MKKALAYVSGTVASFVPVAVALAGGTSNFNTERLNTIVGGFKGIINTALIVLSGVAVLVFIYGIIRFVLSAGDAEKRKESRGYMIYGVIAFAIIAGLYGLSNALLDFFGVSTSDSLNVPQVNVRP